ncbi:MAG: TetR/AcrR family transcriptional regulator [Segniliparus sp.]|uniref:TetR/AcrR family transcriptional regulator n=1 Tax=Segniliparus sp. TaxID=2804064 RepID=UPI003F3D9F00
MASPAPHRRGEHVRRVVLDAAFQELVENGVANMTVAGVARRCGVHATTIYRRWTTRENLLFDAMTARSSDAIPPADTGSTRDDFLALTRAGAAYLDSPVGRTALHAATLKADDAYNTARTAFWQSRIRALSPVVDRAVARGDLPAETDPRIVLEALMAPLHARVLLTDDPIPEDLPERLVDILLDGAAVRGGRTTGAGQENPRRPID